MFEHYLIDNKPVKKKKAYDDPDYDENDIEEYGDPEFDKVWDSDVEFEKEAGDTIFDKELIGDLLEETKAKEKNPPQQDNLQSSIQDDEWEEV